MADVEYSKTGAGSNLLDRWKMMSRQRQVVVVVLVLAFLVFLIMLIQVALKPQYVVLYRNLDPAAASPLLQELRSRGVPYQLDDYGSTIKVPANVSDELRIEMAGKGLPFAQDLGFELFDNDRLGMTDFERQVTLQRALQEELRRTITSLDAVTQARVHLALPEHRVFMRERTEPSASVYLKLNPYVDLRENQVRGIVFLVASAVEDLTAENITVIDSYGNILYDALTTEDPMMAVGESTLRQLEVKRTFERELEDRVQRMLERVFGPGKALVVVTTELDFDARETTVITYDEQGVPRSSHVLEESFEGEGPVMGEVGEANYPGYVGVVPGGDSQYQRFEETINYEISERTEHIIAAPGRVLSKHTSVVIDSMDPQVTQGEIEQVNALVASAIGFNEERGDQISVEGMSFDTRHIDEMEAAMAALEEEEKRQQLFQQAIIGAATLALILLILIALWRRRRLMAEREIIPVTEGPSLEELLAMEEEEFIPDRTEETTSKRARELIDKNPDVAIAVLKSWIVED